jgi:hypothetical protein
VFHFLAQGKQPIILVIARKMYKELPEELKEPLAQGRLLIISTSSAVRQSKATAHARNKYICELADQILFVGKSIGTAVAAAYDQKHAVGAKHIIFTPIPQTFNLLHTGCGIVYHGNADPWCETALAIEKCSSLDLPLHIITGANHSLETKSVTADIQNMSEILWQIVEYTELL